MDQLAYDALCWLGQGRVHDVHRTIEEHECVRCSRLEVLSALRRLVAAEKAVEHADGTFRLPGYAPQPAA